MADVAEALRRLGRKTRRSMQGWRAAWATQASLRQWTGVTAVSTVFVLVLNPSAGERALILALGLLLPAVELFNTAIEAAVEFVSTARDPRAAMARDCASAAVALTALAGFFAWCAILWGGTGWPCAGAPEGPCDMERHHRAAPGKASPMSYNDLSKGKSASGHSIMDDMEPVKRSVSAAALRAARTGQPQPEPEPVIKAKASSAT
jgi:diacylglycerol kinase (ATP)